MADMVRGRNPSQRTLPQAVLDFMLIHETGWSLEYVRNMLPKDRRAFDIMSQFSYNSKLQKTALG